MQIASKGSEVGQTHLGRN